MADIEITVETDGAWLKEVISQINAINTAMETVQTGLTNLSEILDENSPIWNEKYDLPIGGIPFADLAGALQELIKGALQKTDPMIPTQATADNQLTTQEFVNSSISHMTANRVTYTVDGGSFPTNADLINATVVYHGGIEYTPTNHDYATISVTNPCPDPNYLDGQTFWEFDGTQWVYMIGINEKPFTAAETAAIASEWTNALTNRYINTEQIAAAALPATSTAAAAAKLATPHTINGIPFDGTEDITITAVANDGFSNRPDKWEIGTEYDFGNGLYGQRFTGTISGARSTTIITSLLPIGSNYKQTIEAGGWWRTGGNETETAIFGQSFLGYNNAITDAIVSLITTYIDGNINLYTRSAYARSAMPYDVWIKYTK